MKKLLVLLCVLGLLSGCVVPFRTPPDLAHIRLSAVSSTQVGVDKLWLQRADDGSLHLHGYVIRRIRAEDTTTTHLDVLILDASGREIAREKVAFTPAQLPVRQRMRGVGEFEVRINSIPASISQIEVRAHEVDPKQVTPSNHE